jgi:tetratricopeptide (TPR) repeat protein
MDENDTVCERLREELAHLADQLDAEGVLRVSREVLQHCSWEYETLCAAGWALVRVERVAEAEPILELCARIRPEDASVWWALGMASLLGEAYEQSAEALRRAVAIRDAFNTRDTMAHVLVMQGLREAELVLRDGLAQDAHNRALLLELASNLEAQGRADEARELRRGVEDQPSRAPRQGPEKPRSASGATAEAALANGDLSRVRELLEVYAQDKNKDRVVEVVEELRVRDVHDYDLLWAASLALFRVECHAMAIPLLERCTKDRPDEPAAWLSLGTALEAHGAHHRAETALRKALELREIPSARIELAWILTGRALREAGAVLEEGVRLQPNHRERLEALAENLREQQRNEEAAELEARAAQLPTAEERRAHRRGKGNE